MLSSKADNFDSNELNYVWFCEIKFSKRVLVLVEGMFNESTYIAFYLLMVIFLLSQTHWILEL